MNRTFQFILTCFILTMAMTIHAQTDSTYFQETVKPRIRVIIDNDFGGDPDGLFQLVHHILSPSVQIKGIIGSQNYNNGFYGSPGSAVYACTVIHELLAAMPYAAKIPVYEGGASGLSNISIPVISDASKAIVHEAMRQDTKMPLYIVCGAGLTNIASAYLMEPRIANKIILIWIGGPEYKGVAIPPQGRKKLEYNMGIDVKAAQVIFNTSDIPIWQVPRDAYRQALYSYAELIYKIKSNGIVGKFLINKLEDLMKRAKCSLGESYVLGDSPLVLLTALQTSWEADPASCKYLVKPTPVINDAGFYNEVSGGRPIRVYTNIDTRLILDDLVAKLALLNMK